MCGVIRIILHIIALKYIIFGFKPFMKTFTKFNYANKHNSTTKITLQNVSIHQTIRTRNTNAIANLNHERCYPQRRFIAAQLNRHKHSKNKNLGHVISVGGYSRGSSPTCCWSGWSAPADMRGYRCVRGYTDTLIRSPRLATPNGLTQSCDSRNGKEFCQHYCIYSINLYKISNVYNSEVLVL